MADAGCLQRIGSSVLSGLGLTRKHHFRRVAADVERLEDEIRHLRSEIEALAPPRSPRLSPDQFGDNTLSGQLMVRNHQLQVALSELEFRANHLRDVIAGQGSGCLHGCGHPVPSLSPLPSAAVSAVHAKQYASRPLINGLTAWQACHLEALCLTRLQEEGGEAAAHFPAVVEMDSRRHRIVLTHQGLSLDRVARTDRASVAAQIRDSFREQLAVIVNAMKRARVVHLDMRPTGHNITVDDDGRLSLIDFDTALIDDSPFSAEIARRHAEWLNGGRYGRTLNQLIHVVELFLRSAR